MPSRAADSPLTHLLRIAALAAVYFLTGKLGLYFAYLEGNASLIWPPAGLSIAALVLGGLKLWPGVTIGALAVTLITPATALTAIGIAAGNTAAALIAASLLLASGFDPLFKKLRDLLQFSLFGIVVESTLSAVLGTLSLRLSESMTSSSFFATWKVWALGDAVGILVVAPALLSWAGFRPAKKHREDLREGALLAAGLIAVSVLIWGILSTSPHSTPLAYLLFPLVIWAALGFGVRGATAATLAIAAVAIAGTRAGAGPFAREDPYESAIYLWTFLGVVAVTALGVAILFARYRRQATQSESEARSKLALEGSEEGIWDWDLTTHKMVVDERWAAMLGYQLDELDLTWQGWIKLVHPADAAGVKKAVEAHLEGKLPIYQTEHRMRDQEGQWRFIAARGKVVERDELGRPLRMSGTHKDITQRKLAREAQVRSEALIRAILETAPDGVITFNRRGHVESFNAAAERIFGYATAEILGREIRLLVPSPEGDEGFLDEFLNAETPRVSGRTREVLGRRRDATTFPLELSLGEVQLREGQRLYTAIVRDITVRKEAEENLKLFRAMVENTSEGVQLTRIADEVIVYANPALEKMFGYGPGELMGEPVRRIYAADKTGTGEFLDQMNTQVTREGLWRGEVRARRQDASVFWCRIRISTFDHPKFGRVWVSVHEDITDQVRAEEERRWLEDQLRQAHRLESVGQLAGGVAHEFNNLLVVIGGHLDFALEGLGEDAPTRADIEQAQAASDRAAALTHQLLAFSRRQVLKPVDVELNEVIEELMTMLRTAVTEDISIEHRPGANLGTVHVDVRQIEQVILNLCLNARDAMPEGGTVRILTDNVELDQDYCRRHPWARPGSYVLLAVEDTGAGMAPEVLDRIFEPFFTTKAEGAGTGLGLAMVHGVIQQHQALLNVVSEPDRGSTFEIYWPRVDRQVEAPPEASPEDNSLAGAGVLIVAEDDDTVRHVARRILEDGGYTVRTAQNGEEAVRLFEEGEGEVDLVILDLIMPVMGGLAAREEILRLDPSARILLSSGYSAGPMHQGPGGVEIPLVVKPFDRRSLLTQVREVLMPRESPVS